MQHTRVHVLELSEGEVGERGAERLFENIMAKKFPDLVKSINLYIQVA